MDQLSTRLPSPVPPGMYTTCSGRTAGDTQWDIWAGIMRYWWSKLGTRPSSSPMCRSHFLPTLYGGTCGISWIWLHGRPDSDISRRLAPWRPSRCGTFDNLEFARHCQCWWFANDPIFPFFDQGVPDIFPTCRIKWRHSPPLPHLSNTRSYPCRTSMPQHAVTPWQKHHLRWPRENSSCRICCGALGGLVMSWLGSHQFGQIGWAKPRQTVACSLSHGSHALLYLNVCLFRW